MRDFPNDKYEEIINRLKHIEMKLDHIQYLPKKLIIDNADFLQIMKISSRTARTWREKGLVGFSNVGGKIFYKVSEIQELIEKSYKINKI